jgi:hypothetical protein
MNVKKAARDRYIRCDDKGSTRSLDRSARRTSPINAARLDSSADRADSILYVVEFRQMPYLGTSVVSIQRTRARTSQMIVSKASFRGIGMIRSATTSEYERNAEMFLGRACALIIAVSSCPPHDFLAGGRKVPCSKQTKSCAASIACKNPFRGTPREWKGRSKSGIAQSRSAIYLARPHH